MTLACDFVTLSPMPRKSARLSPKNRKRKTKKLKARYRKIAYAMQLSAVFLISTIFLGGYLVYKYLNMNFAAAYSGNTFYADERLTPSVAYIVVDSFEGDTPEISRLEYIIYDKNNKKVLKYVLPVKTIVDVPGDFGEATLSKIFLVASLNNDNPLDAGIQIVSNVLFRTFGFGVDYYIVTNETLSTAFDEYLNEGKYGEFVSLNNILEMRQVMKTNISVKKFYELGNFIKGIPSDRVFSREITQGYLNNMSIIDDEIKDTSFESIVSQERYSIAVLNGTEYEGLAVFGSRVVDNVGGRVVAVNNSDVLYENSYVISGDPSCYTAGYMADIFGISNIMSKEEAFDFSDNELDRADLVIILGLDTATRLY
ncbi:LytR C-terminal domain-containing protein [Patescibacteria group bacterium]|nr:LytR C-terminal domain-containing protein [Patescibacteria group bacterium]